MTARSEARALRVAVAILSLIPVGAGLAGMLWGSDLVSNATRDVSLDSHVRYLSGLLFAIGLGFWSTIAHIETSGRRFLALTAIVFVGGLARLLGVVEMGLPSLPMLGGLLMELVVTPGLCLWRWRVARQSRGTP